MSTSTRVGGGFLPGAKFSRFSAPWATKRFRPPARRTENLRSHLSLPDRSSRPHRHACSGLDWLDLGLDNSAKTRSSAYYNVPPNAVATSPFRLPSHRPRPFHRRSGTGGVSLCL